MACGGNGKPFGNTFDNTEEYGFDNLKHNDLLLPIDNTVMIYYIGRICKQNLSVHILPWKSLQFVHYKQVFCSII